MAISYQLKDELKLSPSGSQFAITVAFMPWSVKPLYGILSDCIPIKGSRRVPYLIISSVLSFIPWLLLGLFEPIRMSSVSMTGILTIQNLGAAMADVVIDAMIAEAARKERAEYAGDLQSMSWFAMALGGMLGSVVGGFALSAFDVNGIFLLFSIFPLLQLVACGLIDEKALTGGVTEVDHEKEEAGERIQEREAVEENLLYAKPTSDELQCNNEDSTGEGTVQAEGFFKADGNKGVVLEKGIGMGESKDHERDLVDEDGDWVEVEANKAEDTSESSKSSSIRRNIEGNVSAPRGRVYFKESDPSYGAHLRRRKHEVEIDGEKKEGNVEVESKKHDLYFLSKIRGTFWTLFQTIRQPAIRQPMLWFFLAQVSVPSLSTIMFYYQTNHLHLDASFLGTSRLVGWGALMLGTFLYNQYLKNVPLRRIFWWTHIALAFITLSDIVLVSGLNARLGIPDKAFIVGASALGDAVNQFKFMPFLVLSGRLCEPGIEGTLFALFMSLNNLGTNLSSFFGAGLASVLHISSDQFENFGMGICIQSLCTIIPILFLHLIPEGTGVSVNKFS